MSSSNGSNTNTSGAGAVQSGFTASWTPSQSAPPSWWPPSNPRQLSQAPIYNHNRHGAPIAHRPMAHGRPYGPQPHVYINFHHQNYHIPRPMEQQRMVYPPHYWRPFTVQDNMMIRDGILNQVHYYFSDANLVKDQFLRENMDESGWVELSLIASFPRMQNLTRDISYIWASLQKSNIVELQGYKVRRRNEWSKWLLPRHLRSFKK
ncbi:hypothetical protein ABFX02_03G075400 [Erythranthe guttata]